MKFRPCSLLLLWMLLAPLSGASAQEPELTVDKVPSPLEAGLSWTGGVPAYEIYRGTDAAMLFSPANKLGESSGSQWSVGATGAPDLVFYSVRATGRCFFTQTDALIIEGDPAANYGSLTSFQLANNAAAGGRQHTLMRFELSQIPPGSQITSATLDLQLKTWGGGQLDIDFRPATQPWEEAFVDWNHRPATGASAGVDSLVSLAGWKELDVTALVQGWVDDPAQNFGVSLEPINETFIWSFDSSERPPGDRGPRLCVQWDSPQDQALTQLAAGATRTPGASSRDGQMQFWSGRIRTGGSATDPVVQALDHLYDFRHLYEFDDPQGELYLSRVITDGDRQDVIFQQRIQNIPVYASEVAVHLRNRYVEATSSYLLNPPAELPEVAIGPDQAQTLAHGAVIGDDPLPMGQPVLMVFSLEPVTRQPSPTHLVWRVLVETLVEGVAETWEAMVSVEDGQIVHLSGFDQSLGGTPNKNFDIMSANNNEPRGFCYNLSLNTSNWYDENGQVNYNASNDPRGEGPLTFSNTHNTYDLYYNNFGRRSLNDSDNQVEVMLRYGNGVRNAFWSGPCKHMRFGDGYAVTDVYAHEYTHGVVDFTSKLVYRSEPGALNESLADVFGSFADFEFGDGDWTIAEDIPRSLVNNPCDPVDGRFRDMADPPACGHPDHVLAAVSGNGVGLRKTINPQCGTGGNDCGFVHSNSGIPNKAAFLIADGGLHNGFVMAGIGHAKAKRLYYDTMVSRLRKSSQFGDMRDAIVDVARDYVRQGDHGFIAQDACTVINAFHSVGLGDPDEDCDGDPEPLGSLGDPDGDFLDGVNDNCPWVKNIDQDDLDGDGLGDACDEDLDGDGDDNRYDNCIDVPNPNQADSNSNNRGDACDDDDGDGIDNPLDNCPQFPNSLQKDNDGDGVGDKCDGDDDNDGLADTFDPCPFDSVTTGDADGDGVGNACDNCAEDPNANQSDIDGDGDGDVCDVDRDGDGWLNINDNCPDVPNPDQVDGDGNGYGLECDLPERGWFDGIEQLGDWIFFVQQKLDRPVSLPILPCTSQCPDWIEPGTLTIVNLATSPAMIPRIVDNYGNVVDAEVLQTNGTYQLKFPPATDYSYLSPALAEVPHTSPFALQRMQARSYRLELFARPGSVEQPVEVIVNVETQLAP